MTNLPKTHEYYEEAVAGILRKFSPYGTDALETILQKELLSEGNVLQFIKNPSEDFIIEAVRQHGRSIQHVDEPSEEVQLVSIIQNIANIIYIKNPSKSIISYYNEKLREEGVPEGHEYYDEIKLSVMSTLKPDQDIDVVVTYCCSQKSIAIKHVNNPSEQFIKEAIAQNGNCIRYVKNPTEEMQRLAVENDVYSIVDIKHPSYDLAMKAWRGADVVDDLVKINDYTKVSKQIENYIACNELVIGKDYEKMPEHHIYKFHDKGHQLSYELITKG